MVIKNKTILIKTAAKSFNDITSRIKDEVRLSKINEGNCTLFIKHTSASLIIQENADPSVLKDIENFFKKLVPENNDLYIHTAEGPDDMPAHIRSLLTNTSLSIPIIEKELQLGTWQGIYLYEHRNHNLERKVIVNILGE